MKNVFYGRKNQLELLSKRVNGLKYGYRQNLAILGDELVGKTSLVFKFLQGHYDLSTVILYIEARPETLADFSKRFIGILLYNFLLPSGIALKEDLGCLIQEAQDYIPRTCEKIKLILAGLAKRKKNTVFAELLSLCGLIYEETSKSCVVIFDEFHNLENLGVINLYSEWSNALLTQKSTMYIIISSRKAKARTILSKELALLFGNFEVAALEPFDIKESEAYLNNRLPPAELDPALRDFIVHFTGGYPFYLDVISSSFSRPQEQSLPVVLEEVLFEPSGLLHQRFSNYLKQFLDSPYSQDYLPLLYLVASGHNRINDLPQLMRKPKKDILSRIGYLTEADCLNRSADFASINDRVFGFWLKFVYRQKELSLTFDARNQKALFCSCLEEMIKEFIQHSRKPVVERVSELLRLFSDDTMQVEKKRLRLDRFREIKHLTFPGRGLKEGLLGRSRDSLWIMAFKKEFITEEDILDFARECKKYRHKLQRKIIVTLENIDTNACLRAMDEKIWTWDLGSLNRIMDLYSRPRIIA